jgi:UDP-3-O-acyl-N-acetylglucosamine deacetylase
MPDTIAYNQYVEQPFQTTVRDRVKFDGIGLHSGRFVELTICPASANSGIKFRRIDIDASCKPFMLTQNSLNKHGYARVLSITTAFVLKQSNI